MARGKRDIEQVVGQITFAEFSTSLTEYVVQSNSLITAKQSLSLNSSKLIRAAIKQIDLEDTEFKPYIITIPDISRMLNIAPSNLYKYIWDITDNIIENPVKFKQVIGGKISWTKIPWIQECDYHPDIGLVLHLNEKLKPFLLNLEQEYGYSYDKISEMKSIYSIRIFEIINSQIGNEAIPPAGTHVIIRIEDLKEACDCEDKYKEFSNFRMRVLDGAVKEINVFSNYKVSYTYIKEGRKVAYIDFLVEPINNEIQVVDQTDGDISGE